MAYATEAEVEARIAKHTIDGSSSPDSSQVGLLIDETAGEIDSLLAEQGVTVPVTTPAYFLDFLVGCNANGAAARTLKSMFPDVTGPGQQPAFQYYQDEYVRQIEGLKDGSLIPPGATRTGSTGPSTYFTVNPDEETDEGDIAEGPFHVATQF